MVMVLGPNQWKHCLTLTMSALFFRSAAFGMATAYGRWAWPAAGKSRTFLLIENCRVSDANHGHW
jgi:hypothetical protein